MKDKNVENKLDSIFEKIKQNSTEVCEHYSKLRKESDKFVKRLEYSIIGLGINYVDDIPFYTDIYSDYYFVIDNNVIKVKIDDYFDKKNTSIVKFNQVSSECSKAIMKHAERILEIVHKLSEDSKRRSTTKTMKHLEKYNSYQYGNTTAHEFFYSVSDMNNLRCNERTYLRWAMHEISDIKNEDDFFESKITVNQDYLQRLINKLNSWKEDFQTNDGEENTDKIISIINDIISDNFR